MGLSAPAVPWLNVAMAPATSSVTERTPSDAVKFPVVAVKPAAEVKTPATVHVSAVVPAPKAAEPGVPL